MTRDAASARTTVALFSRSHDLSFLAPLLLREDPTLDIVVWPDPRCLDARVAVGWDAPPGMYTEMPALELVHGIAAGVDNLIQGHALQGARVCRVVEPQLGEGMLQFVLWAVLHFHRGIDRVVAQQAHGELRYGRATGGPQHRAAPVGRSAVERRGSAARLLSRGAAGAGIWQEP